MSAWLADGPSRWAGGQPHSIARPGWTLMSRPSQHPLKHPGMTGQTSLHGAAPVPPAPLSQISVWLNSDVERYMCEAVEGKME